MAHVLERRMGWLLKKSLLPEETFYNWGDETGLYYYSQHSPPTGVLRREHLFTSAAEQGLSERVLEDLKRTRPELVIAYRDQLVADRNIEHPVLKWCLSNYHPLPSGSSIGPYVLLFLKDGRLEKRVLSARKQPSSAAR